MRLPPTLHEFFTRFRKHRAPALAAEVAFFGVLSIPPLLVGLVATAGLVAHAMGPQTVTNITDQLVQLSGNLFSADVTERLVRPSIQEVLNKQRLDALSLGYLLAIWSGSRMINSTYQSVEILSEETSERSALDRRLRSIKTVVLGFLAVTVALPLVLAGPRLLARFLPWYLNLVAWLGVAVIASIAVAWILREALPTTPAWKPAIVSGLIIIAGWAVSSVILQFWFARTMAKGSLYGPLAAPIALLLWLQLMALIFLCVATVIALRSGVPSVPTPRQRH